MCNVNSGYSIETAQQQTLSKPLFERYFWGILLFFYLHECPCECTPHMQSQNRKLDLLALVTGGCELSDLCAGN